MWTSVDLSAKCVYFTDTKPGHTFIRFYFHSSQFLIHHRFNSIWAELCTALALKVRNSVYFEIIIWCSATKIVVRKIHIHTWCFHDAGHKHRSIIEFNSTKTKQRTFKSIRMLMWSVKVVTWTTTICFKLFSLLLFSFLHSFFFFSFLIFFLFVHFPLVRSSCTMCVCVCVWVKWGLNAEGWWLKTEARRLKLFPRQFVRAATNKSFGSQLLKIYYASDVKNM